VNTKASDSGATIYEVARMSGFSTATVSRVMHDGTGFSAATKQSVLEAAARLGWVPNHSARSLARRRTGIVGLLFSDFASDDSDVGSESALYVDQVIRGAERVATEAGDAILIAATRGRDGLQLARSLVGKVDGLVVLAGSLTPQQLTDVAQRIPVVLMATRTAPARLDLVGADNRGGARAVTEHLLHTHGLREIAFVAGPPRSPDSKERFVGFARALTDAGLTAPGAPEAHGGFTEAGGARAVEEILAARRTPPRAIVFGNDEMAIGGLGVLRRHKLRVPADVAVTGFDDIATGRHVRPSLTTVRQPMHEIGQTAVRTLLERLADRDAPRRKAVLATDLVLRSSCGCSTRGGKS
jgi:LacI family transcriptional regulator